MLLVEAGDRVAECELVARYRRGVAVILRKALNWQKVRAGQKLSDFVRSMARNLAGPFPESAAR